MIKVEDMSLAVSEIINNSIEEYVSMPLSDQQKDFVINVDCSNASINDLRRLRNIEKGNFCKVRRTVPTKHNVKHDGYDDEYRPGLGYLIILIMFLCVYFLILLH